MNIPNEAVEAAAKWLHDNNCRSALHSGLPADEECYGWREEARELLEAAAPHLTEASPIDLANFTRMVDEVLEHKGTPRRKLFEYPYRDDDSRDAIKSAETLVRDILRMARRNV